MFTALVIGLIAGILSIQLLPWLPGRALFVLALALAVVLALVAGLRLRGARAGLVAGCAGLLLGIGLSGLQGHHMHETLRLPDACLYRPLVVEGEITGLPVNAPGYRGFLLRPHRVMPAACRPHGGQFRLGWRRGNGASLPELHPGQRWRLTLRLRPVRNFHTPGAFDLEALRLEQGIRYRGSVRDGTLLAPAAPGLDGLREHLARFLRDSALDPRAAAILPALVTGDRQGLDAETWQTLRRTGTVHLMAISGLHIGLVAGLVMLLVRLLWSLVLWLALRVAAPRVAALAGIGAAAGYAALAGFSLPTQRALLMLGLWLGARFMGRALSPARVLTISLGLLAAIDPFALTSAGFWLSFAAVGLLILALRGWEQRSMVANWARAQGLLALGMLPLQVLFFQGASPLAPLANLIAVPLVGSVVVPLVLLASVLHGFLPSLAAWLTGVASFLLHVCWQVLEWLGDQPLAWITLAQPPAWALALSLLGIAWLLMPRGWPLRILGLALVPLLLVPAARAPESGTAEVHVLDVGQGLAVAIRTRAHTLLFDTGPRLGPGYDAGRAVILPWLWRQDIRRIDTLILSHGDSDHAGGLASLRAALSIGRMLQGPDPRMPLQPGAERCRSGQRWQWDGVRFRVVHPPENWPLPVNEGSCVLLVEAGGRRVLLPGDIEDLAEFRLARELKLQADVLLLAHHGSRTSTTDLLLDSLKPGLALVSRGDHNAFRMPHPSVRGRLAERHIPLHDTALEGTLTLRLDGKGGLQLLPGARARLRRWWHHPMQVTNWPFGHETDMPRTPKSSMIRASRNP